MSLSGNLVRSAHYERFTSVAGVSPAHTEQSPGRGMFEPTPEASVPPAPGNLFAPRDVTPHTAAQVRTAEHWENSSAQPIPSGVDEERGQNTVQSRMVEAHSRTAYTPECYDRFISPTAGRTIEWTEGRAPIQPNVDAFLTGPNGYDFSNPPSEVYGGQRYRLGTDNHIFGRYQFWTKQGQDAWLRPTVTEYPILPVDKPNIADPAPYSSPTSGTARWRLPSFQDPRMFTTPSETGMSDYVMAQRGEPGPAAGFSEFEDGGRM
jgi:hypothetical protein